MAIRFARHETMISTELRWSVFLIWSGKAEPEKTPILDSSALHPCALISFRMASHQDKLIVGSPSTRLDLISLGHGWLQFYSTCWWHIYKFVGPVHDGLNSYDIINLEASTSAQFMRPISICLRSDIANHILVRVIIGDQINDLWGIDIERNDLFVEFASNSIKAYFNRSLGLPAL